MASVRVECCESRQIANQREQVLRRLGFTDFTIVEPGTVTTAKIGIGLQATNEAIVFRDCRCVLLAS
jgi:hypothetical protein